MCEVFYGTLIKLSYLGSGTGERGARVLHTDLKMAQSLLVTGP